MAWDMTKCRWGVPANFTNTDAENAVRNANFSASVYVNISSAQQMTKQAYCFYEFGGFRICVVGHVHRDSNQQWTIAGNSFIPGWAGWDMTTPANQVTVIGGLQAGGAFPGDDRYPHPL